MCRQQSQRGPAEAAEEAGAGAGRVLVARDGRAARGAGRTRAFLGRMHARSRSRPRPRLRLRVRLRRAQRREHAARGHLAHVPPLLRCNTTRHPRGSLLRLKKILQGLLRLERPSYLGDLIMSGNL